MQMHGKFEKFPFTDVLFGLVSYNDLWENEAFLRSRGPWAGPDG